MGEDLLNNIRATNLGWNIYVKKMPHRRSILLKFWDGVILQKKRLLSAIPGSYVPVIILWGGLQDVNSHSVTGVISKTENLRAHQRLLDKR